MLKRTLFRGIVERSLTGLMCAMLILSCSLLISPQKAQAETCSDYDLRTIAAGESHTVGVKEDGTVVVVGDGDNTYGQWNVTSWTNIKTVAAGRLHTVGLHEDGTVEAVGYPGHDRLKVSSWKNIKAIAAGYEHTVGLREDGTVVATGHSLYGQTDVSSWANIKAIAAGQYHTVGLKEDGTVVTAGDNRAGQRNLDATWNNIKAIAAGKDFTLGLKEDGTLVTAGQNRHGQRDVSSWTNIKTIAAGGFHTLGLQEDGTVEAKGYNYYGQRDEVSPWTSITAVAAGGFHSVGLKEDGTVETVGYKADAGESLNTSGWSHIAQPKCKIAVPVDKIAPELSIAVAPAVLWPPNHKMVTVTPTISVQDDLDAAPQVKLLSVTSSEPDNGLGDGDTANDIVINSDGSLSLRAERSGKGSGRTYTITYQATDAAGNVTNAAATVAVVPHNN